MPQTVSARTKTIHRDEGWAFSLLFKGHPLPMYVYSLKTLAILDVNDSAVKKYGYSRKEFQGLSFPQFVPEGNGNFKEGGQHELGILLHKCKNGIGIERETNAYVIEFNGEEAALVITRDLAHDHMDTEAELHALFASMQDLVLVIDRDGVYRKVAPTSTTSMLIKPRDEIVGKNLRDFFPAERTAFFLESIRQVLSTGQPTHIEYDLILETRTVWFAASISPMDDTSTLWVVRDITDRKQTGKALRESEERYRSLFDRMMDGVYRSTHEGKFIDVNLAMVKMFGYESKEEMLAIDIKTELYFDPEERGTHVLDTGEGETDIYRLRRKDGSEIWVEDRGSYVYDDQGNVLYHEGTLRDVTARRQAEEELRRAKATLEKTNRELELVLIREQHLARTDGLTGLYNYRYFFELATREFKTAMRYRRPLSVLMFDADDFKNVNDTLGHSAGDRILTSIAQATAAQMRSVDILARYGGDEFVILLPQTNAKQAYPIAERIRSNVASMSISTENGSFSVSLSIGIAEICYVPPDESVEHIVQRADKALYTAKQAGRNRIATYDRAKNGSP